jgi:alpha-galactosidase
LHDTRDRAASSKEGVDRGRADVNVKPHSSSRRAFLAGSLQVGAGALLANSAGERIVHAEEAATEVRQASSVKSKPQALVDLPKLPARVFIEHESNMVVAASRTGLQFSSDRGVVQFDETTDEVAIRVTCPNGPLSRVIARWDVRFPQDTLYLGDAWERSYGDLQWRYTQPERIMPWYFAAHHPATRRTFMLGVKTQPSALCFWMADREGISLWMDFRNGGSPSIPGQREIPAATVIALQAHEDEAPFSALRRFCRLLCPKPRLAAAPVCGSNNWYYTYGANIGAAASRRDAAFLAELADGQQNRPFCVIDGGWTPGGGGPGGPWTAGDPKTFPDMPGLAAEMKKLGVRPGIWIRPTALNIVDNPERLRSGPVHDKQKPLDLTLPENLASVHDDTARMRSWGYELIKHDFSTYDLFGRWGFDMGAEITEPGWHFYDRSLTNAEIILRHYRILREAAGDAVLIGCNTMGHLGAGYFEVQRIGDDVSGRVWERTRRMGVNTLAYRLAQNGIFFGCDPDCAAHTEKTPWELDRQFLDLVARSGSVLFVSADPQKVTPEQKAAYSAAMKLALAGGANGEPLDWLENTTPEQWLLDKEHVSYQWSEPMGVSPFRV